MKITLDVDDRGLAWAVAAANARRQTPLTAAEFLQDYLNALGAMWNAKADAEEAGQLRQTFDAKPITERRTLLGVLGGR